MKFFFADSLDCVDPKFDFINDRFDPGRNRQSGDVFAHEVLGKPPYHGILLSYAAVGTCHKTSRFSQGQRMRLFRDGVHAFYRVPKGGHSSSLEQFPIMGDSGAFSFRNYEKLPFNLEELFDYYQTCGFTHGVSLDCVISDKNPKWDDVRRLPTEVDARAKYTLKQAAAFLKLHRQKKGSFTPIGVIQAWSPKSAADHARKLVDMGYGYLGLGGVAQRPSGEIVDILSEIRSNIPDDVRLHVFGLARFSTLSDFLGIGIESFDSSSPMLKAFKDDKSNYFLANGKSYLAIRLPAMSELSRTITEEAVIQRIETSERDTLNALRSYDAGQGSLVAALDHLDVHCQLLDLPLRRQEYQRTLEDAAWKACPCSVCKEIGIDVILFRGLNRNKRRGYHNLHVLGEIVHGLNERNYLEYPCIRTEQNPGKTIYSFVANGGDLFKFSKISRIRRDDDGSLLGYQRARVDEHINDIRAYLEKADSMLPNSLVVAFDKRISFHAQETQSGNRLGSLRIPMDFSDRPAWIVDGQQRATALNRLKRKDYPVSVVGFVADDVKTEREQFVLVNNVRPLPKSLVYELLPSLDGAIPPKFAKRQRAYRLLERLNHGEDSPFRGRIKTETNKTDPQAVIKDLSVLKMIENSFENGILALYPKSEQEPYKIIRNYWSAVAETFPKAWGLPPRQSRLTHGVGIVSMGYLMDAVIGRLRAEKTATAIPFIKRELKRFQDLPWCSGVWEFSEDLKMPWDQLQNTNLHIGMVSNFLVRI